MQYSPITLIIQFDPLRWIDAVLYVPTSRPTLILDQQRIACTANCFISLVKIGFTPPTQQSICNYISRPLPGAAEE